MAKVRSARSRLSERTGEERKTIEEESRGE